MLLAGIIKGKKENLFTYLSYDKSRNVKYNNEKNKENYSHFHADVHLSTGYQWI